MSTESAIRDYANEAADAYLNGGVPLNDTIQKIASREDLNPEQICRVCETSNQDTFLSLFKGAEDKTFTFPLADPNEVMTSIREKEASKNYSPTQMTKVERFQEKAASAHITEIREDVFGTTLQRGWAKHADMQLIQGIAGEAKAVSDRKLFEASMNFCKVANDMVALDGYSYQTILNAVAGSRPQMLMKCAQLLKVAARVAGTDFEIEHVDDLCKVAAAVDKDLLPYGLTIGGMPVEIVNGQHKIIVALDTLVDQTTENERVNQNVTGVDDTVKYTRKTLHNYLSQVREKGL
jgi:hypothetical protein